MRINGLFTKYLEKLAVILAEAGQRQSNYTLNLLKLT